MEPEETGCSDSWRKSLPGHLSVSGPSENRSFSDFNPQLQQGKDSSFGSRMMIDQPFSDLVQPFGIPTSLARDVNNLDQTTNLQEQQILEAPEWSHKQDWDPKTMMNSLSFLEKKIHQLQDLLHLIVRRKSGITGQKDETLAQQQHLITADLTSIIVQLISTAGSLLPSVKHAMCPERSISQMGKSSEPNPPGGIQENVFVQQSNNVNKVEDSTDSKDIFWSETNCPIADHEMKSDDDADEGEILLPGSYEILQLEKDEILAPHTHFCTICGKGFKRDANLRMHMRGHGDEYKTPAALAKPNKESTSEPVLIKRYSCPYVGCKRNKDHRKFQPLKTILCVKNHYKRTHCDKTYTCSRCNAKKFSVIADLKTHEKHCGRDKWLCSCGTTFSRKDKLFGHIALFQGHTPAIPTEESKGGCAGGPCDRGHCSEGTSEFEQAEFRFHLDGPLETTSVQDAMNVERCTTGSPAAFFPPLGFDTSSLSDYQEFPQPPFEDSDSSFSFLLSVPCNYPPKNGREGGSSTKE